jgi:hypothetical protein
VSSGPVAPPRVGVDWLWSLMVALLDLAASWMP